VLQQIVINTTDEVIGKGERNIRNGWFDEECSETVKNKNEANSKRIQRHKTRGAEEQLTLRRLMSYIYIYMEHPFLMFLDHTQRRSTVGRTPLDE